MKTPRKTARKSGETFKGNIYAGTPEYTEIMNLCTQITVVLESSFDPADIDDEIDRVVSTLKHNIYFTGSDGYASNDAFMVRGDNATMICRPTVFNSICVTSRACFVRNELIDAGYGWPATERHNCTGPYPETVTVKSEDGSTVEYKRDDLFNDESGYETLYFWSFANKQRIYERTDYHDPVTVRPTVSDGAAELLKRTAERLQARLVDAWAPIIAEHRVKIAAEEAEKEAQRLKRKAAREARKQKTK